MALAVPERAPVDAAKELGYDSLKDSIDKDTRNCISAHFPLFQKCE